MFYARCPKNYAVYQIRVQYYDTNVQYYDTNIILASLLQLHLIRFYFYELSSVGND